ncbi:MAG: hypothetical protein IAE79_24105 [Anaerolinea sp.]|nr:hypothetical protein [Anaerolinea sp.]
MIRIKLWRGTTAVANANGRSYPTPHDSLQTQPTCGVSRPQLLLIETAATYTKPPANQLPQITAPHSKRRPAPRSPTVEFRRVAEQRHLQPIVGRLFKLAIDLDGLA